MANLPLPPLHDVARLYDSSLDKLVSNLTAYYRQIVWFNYEPARKVARAVYSGNLQQGTAVRYCLESGIKSGRIPNAQVAALICQLAQGRSFLCHDIKPRSFI
jgi:hypothetical protein